jgi:translation initiation factor 1A
MPKNKGAGGKNRRKGKSSNLGEKKEIIYKIADQEYGQIIKSIGSGHMEVMCFTSNGNVVKRAHIRGSMRKRVWMTAGDIVLVNVRDYQEGVCDILMKYTADEARFLRSRHQIPDNIDINKKDMVEDEFEYENINEIDGSDEENDSDNKNGYFDIESDDSDTEDELKNL